MCIAIPCEIVELFSTKARVTIMGAETTVNIQLIESPKIGDFVLIHAGCAIEKINKDNIDRYIDIFKPILESATEVEHENR